MKTRLVVAAFAMCLAVSTARASVSLQSIAWEFYQGGYVQSDALNFVEIQEHFRSSPEINTVYSMLGSATFESTATMDVSIAHDAASFDFHAVNTLSAFASVSQDDPNGLAHAFAGLSMFIAEFELSDGPYMYTGSDPLESSVGIVQSGDVLTPGVYGFYLIDPFPALTQTSLFVGPGGEELASSSRIFDFTFQQVPQPAGICCFVLFGLPARRRRFGETASRYRL